MPPGQAAELDSWANPLLWEAATITQLLVKAFVILNDSLNHGFRLLEELLRAVYVAQLGEVARLLKDLGTLERKVPSTFESSRGIKAFRHGRSPQIRFPIAKQSQPDSSSLITPSPLSSPGIPGTAR